MRAAMEKMRAQAHDHLPPVNNSIEEDAGCSTNALHLNSEPDEMEENDATDPFSSSILDPVEANHNPPTSSAHPKQHVTLEEIEDEASQPKSSVPHDQQYTVEEFLHAGDPIGVRQSDRLKEYEEQAARNEEPWAPFASYQEWEFAHWLIKSGMSQTEMSKFFKLQWV